MQLELAEMGPELAQAVEEATETMEQIAKDTKVAEQTKKVSDGIDYFASRGG